MRISHLFLPLADANLTATLGGSTEVPTEKPHHIRTSHRHYTCGLAPLPCFFVKYHRASWFSRPCQLSDWVCVVFFSAITLDSSDCPVSSSLSPVFDSQLFHPVLVLSSVRPCSAFSQPIIIVLLLLLLLLYYVYTTQHPPTHLSI